MKKILIIAYYFPPLGGAGVQRTLKFANYLQKFGYEVSVLTVENEFTVIKDDSLSKELVNGIKVYRAAQSEKNVIKKIVNKIINNKNKSNAKVIQNGISKTPNNFTVKIKKVARKLFLKMYSILFIPDDKTSWKKHAVILGNEIIKKEKFDLIYSTSSPYSCHLIARELNKENNIPWISDFRDQWVDNPFVQEPLIVRKINCILERSVVMGSDAVISVSKPIIDDFINRYRKITDVNKFEVITNGYDEEDFNDYNIDFVSKKFIITYNGTLYGNRSPKNFLEAISNLIQKNIINVLDLEIRFVGEIGRDANNDILQFTEKYKNIIKCIDYIPHRESIKYLENSSALLLIIEAGVGSEGIFTGKIFEYIRSGRDIIGIVPDGVARELIKDTNTGYCCYPDSISEIEDSICKSYLTWKGELPKLKVNLEKIQKYSRENLALELKKIIEKI